MENKTTSNGRLIMAITAFVAGLLMLTIVPANGKEITNSIMTSLWGMFEKSGEPAPRAAIDLAATYMPMWVGLTVFAGAILILLAYPIYKGQYWARPMAFGLVALPAITSAFMFGPVMNSSKHLVMKDVQILLIGIIPYLIFLLTEQSSGKIKAKNTTLFLLLGIMVAFSFTNGFSALHELNSRVEPKFYEGEFFTYAFGFPILWLSSFLVIAGIPLLAGRSKVGWWLTTLGTLGMVVMLGMFSIANPNPFYIGNLSLTVLVFILMLSPSFGGRLINMTSGRFTLPSLETKPNDLGYKS